MGRPQSLTPALARLAILLMTCIHYSEGNCDECTIYPFVDSGGYDVETASIKSPADCADYCFDLRNTKGTVVAFAIGKDKECWCKYQLPNRFNAKDIRTIIVMGNQSCRGLFE